MNSPQENDDSRGADLESLPAPSADSERSPVGVFDQHWARGFFAGLVDNLRAGFRLATFRFIRPASLTATVEQLIALVLIDLALTLALDLAVVGPHGSFNLVGIPAALFYLPLMLLAGYLVARIEQAPELALALPIALISAGQYVTLATVLAYLAADADWLDLTGSAGAVVYWGPFVWWVLITAFAIWCMTRRRVLIRLMHLMMVAALVLAPGWYLPRTTIGPLWTDDNANADPQEQARYYAAVSEDAFYAQPDILRRALGALKPGTPGSEEIYFVGVAGYAAEDVFQNEVSVIRRLFEERFDTRGRSISLVNNPSTTLRVPIASVTSLDRTLRRIGRLMNADEDLLFLYLTSHGFEDHRFALSFWPLRLRDLDAPTLRKLLDAGGIRWRIIVVSACYSGGFIDALKTDHTLVITASDANHASFGCGAESDFTYFGKAYFDQALRQTHSFTAGFDIARKAIEKRERAEGKVPSRPQIFLGPAMKHKLERLEEQWKDR